jgi:hypothetical protein
MSTEALWPTTTERGQRAELQAESMQEIRMFSREGRANELGYRLVALRASDSLSIHDMSVAAELPESEVTRIIAVFRAHEQMCRQNEIADRLRRHALAF